MTSFENSCKDNPTKSKQEKETDCVAKYLSNFQGTFLCQLGEQLAKTGITVSAIRSTHCIIVQSLLIRVIIKYEQARRWVQQQSNRGFCDKVQNDRLGQIFPNEKRFEW